MSVALIRTPELEAMHEALGNDMTLLPSLRALAWANRAAYGYQYGEEVNAEIEDPLIRPPDARDQEQIKEQLAKARSIYGTAEGHVKGLLYNCMANDGVDFTPYEAGIEILRAARIADGREPRLSLVEGKG